MNPRDFVLFASLSYSRSSFGQDLLLVIIARKCTTELIQLDELC